MWKLPSSTSTGVELIHQEQEAFFRELKELELALQALACYSEVFANLVSADQVVRCGHHLSQVLPGYRDAGRSLSADLAKRGPELKVFAQEMKRQHQEIGDRLERLCSLVDELETTEDLEETLHQMQERGSELAQQMSSSIPVEEAKLGNSKN